MAMMPEDESKRESDETAILATELLRLDLLNANNMFPVYTGHPIRGSGLFIEVLLFINILTCTPQKRTNATVSSCPGSRVLENYTIKALVSRDHSADTSWLTAR